MAGPSNGKLPPQVVPPELAGANVLLVPGHGHLGGGGGGSGGGGGLGDSCSSFPAHARIAVVVLESLSWVSSPAVHPVCCRCAILVIPVPGLGLRNGRGGRPGGGSGLWGWRTLSFSSGVANLPALVLLLVRNIFWLSLTVPKVVWRLWWTVFARFEGVYWLFIVVVVRYRLSRPP